MIAWLLARPKLIAYGLGALALAGGLWWVAHTVSQWREAYHERPALKARLADADARSAALAESARKVGEALARAEAAISGETVRAQRVRVVYRDAVRTDPSCAEWARQPVRCPLAGR